MRIQATLISLILAASDCNSDTGSCMSHLMAQMDRPLQLVENTAGNAGGFIRITEIF